MAQEPSPNNSLAAFKAFLLLLTIVAGWLFLRQTELGTNLSDYDWVRTQIAERGVFGPLIFIAVGGAITVIGFPRILLSALAGYIFGLLPGVYFALAGTIFGCILSFYYARMLGRSIVEKKMTDRMRQLEEILIKHDFIASILIRMLPVSNNSITNLLAGVTGVHPLHYFTGSAIGYIPLTFVFVLVGNGVQLDMAVRVWSSVGLFAVVVLPIGYFIQRKLWQMGS